MEKRYTDKINGDILSLYRERVTADENKIPKIDCAINLLKLRNERGNRQADLAKALRVDKKNVSQWERAEVAPSLRYLIALAKFYGVTVDHLLSPCE